MPYTEADVQRFWAKVGRAGQAECWLWLASRMDTSGHGQFTLRRDGKQRHLYAHRVMWELTRGLIPDGKVICHTCDVGGCVNPAHLFIGTQQDNLNDARQKGRLVDGLAARKLSDAAYLHILSEPRDYGSGIALALKYGVTKTTISRIRNGHQGSTYRDAHMLGNVEPVPFVHLPIRGEVA